MLKDRIFDAVGRQASRCALAGRMMDKLAAPAAEVLPDSPGSAMVGLERAPTIGGTALGLGAGFLGGKALGAAGSRFGAVAAPVAAALWALNRHLGAPNLTEANLKRRTRLVTEGGPAWMNDPGGPMTDFRNKLLEQDRKLNRIISDRFEDRGDGTYYDKVLGKTVDQKGMSSSVGHLKMLADRQRQSWFSDVSEKINAGRFVYDPVTRTQKLVATPGKGPGDRDYELFRDQIRRQAARRGGLSRMVMPYKVNDQYLWSSSPSLSEEDVRRMYMKSVAY